MAETQTKWNPSAPAYEVKIVNGYAKMVHGPNSQADQVSLAGLSEKLKQRGPTAYSVANGTPSLDNG